MGIALSVLAVIIVGSLIGASERWNQRTEAPTAEFPCSLSDLLAD